MPEEIVNEINKVQLLIRRFLYETKDVVLDAEQSQKWLKEFRDTLHYQELMNNPNSYALELLKEAKEYSNAQRERARARWDAKKKNKQPKQQKPKEQQEPKPEMTRFGEHGNVLLTNEEASKLQQKLGQDFYRAIEILGNYKKSSGKNYKSDYAAILNWVVKRIEEERKQDKPRNNAEFGDYMIQKYFSNGNNFMRHDDDAMQIGLDS